MYESYLNLRTVFAIPSSEGCPQGGVGNLIYGKNSLSASTLQTHPCPSKEGILKRPTPTSPGRGLATYKIYAITMPPSTLKTWPVM